MALDDASPQGGINPGPNAPSTRPSIPSSAPAVANNFRLPDYSHLRVKKELLHRPDLFTLYFGFGGEKWWKEDAAERIVDRLQGTWVLTGRNTTQEEMDAFTVHSTRSLYYGRIGPPLSTFVAGLYMYRGFKKDVPEKSAIGRFMRLKYLALNHRSSFLSLLGGAAFKLFFVASCGAMVSAIVSAYVDVKGLVTDPRLQQWSQDTKSTSEEEVRKRKVFLAHHRFKAHDEATKMLHRTIDGNASSGGYGDLTTEQYNYESPVQNESESQSSQQSAVSSSRPAYGWPSQPQASSQSQSSSDFFGDDDASPTAAEYRNKNVDGSPMSSWDRIRAQSAASNSQKPARQSPTGWTPPQDQSQSADMGPAGARDKYDYEKRREKEQAQADFDQMMENERKGSDTPTQRGWWGS